VLGGNAIVIPLGALLTFLGGLAARRTVPDSAWRGSMPAAAIQRERASAACDLPLPSGRTAVDHL